MDRIAIFIDGGYLTEVNRKELGYVKLKLDRLATKLAKGIDILRSYYYNCPPYQGNPPSADEVARAAGAEKFYSAIRRLPRYELRLGKLRIKGFHCPDCDFEWNQVVCPNCGKSRRNFEQKRIDVMLATDLTALSATRMITHAALLAGDSDYIPAVERAKQEGVQIWLYHGGRMNPAHGELIEKADETTLISPAWVPDIT